MIQLVVFDMAGTTVDEDNVVYKTVRAAINQAGYAVTQDQVQAAGAGKEKRQAIADVLALDGEQHAESEIDQIHADFKSMLSQAYAELQVRPVAGADEVFEQLRQAGIRVVLNTGYDRPTAEGLLGKLNWQVGQRIDGLVTASDVSNGRPAPDMIFRAMELVGVSRADCVAKIGDSQIDIVEGKNAGCGMTFGITTGAQTREQLEAAQPTHIVDSLTEMCQLIDSTSNAAVS